MAKRIEIWDDAGNPVEGLGITDIEVRKNSRMTSSPIETGQTTFDGKVLDPPTITVKCLIHKKDYASAIKKLNEMYTNRTFKFYTVVTKEGEDVGVYLNYAVTGIPHTENADMIDAVAYTVTLQKAVIIGKRQQTKNPSDSNTVKSGTKT